jgi:hypothetical protein
MNTKLRTPRPHQGQMKVGWGYTANEGETLYYCRGPGIPREDGHMFHHALSAKRARVQLGAPLGVAYEPSFLEELEARGYDITTLKISIEKKKN